MPANQRGKGRAMSINNAMRDRILRPTEVCRYCGIGLTTLYRLMKIGKFPRPLALSPGCVGWKFSTVRAWRDARPTVEPVDYPTYQDYGPVRRMKAAS
jgi:prophage regulatory protein